MRVVPIAHTILTPSFFDLCEGLGFDIDLSSSTFTTNDSDLIGEFAGRTCYLSYNKPNPDTRLNKDYMVNIINQGHLSVLEHSSVSLYVDGVSRNLLLELERHRHLSFSVVSTRYVDPSKMSFVVHPSIPNDEGWEYDLATTIAQTSKDVARDIYDRLLQRGLSRKQAREAARCVLPGGTETKFVVTGNLRTWREIIQKRASEYADVEIHNFAVAVLKHLKNISPNSVQDLELS